MRSSVWGGSTGSSPRSKPRPIRPPGRRTSDPAPQNLTDGARAAVATVRLLPGASSGASIENGLKHFGNNSLVKAYHRSVPIVLVREVQVVARPIVSHVDAQHGCA